MKLLTSLLLATSVFAPTILHAGTSDIMQKTKDALATEDVDSSCFLATEPRYMESLDGTHEILVLTKFPNLPDGSCDFSKLSVSLIRHIPESDRDYSKDYVRTIETTGKYIDIGTDGTVDTYYPGDAGPLNEPKDLYLQILKELFGSK